MFRRWLLSGLTIALMGSVLLAKPGVVKNKQGETFKGDVTEDEKYVYINGPGGQLKLDKRNIDEIKYDATIDDQYKTRHDKLAANDVKGRIDLADWANENQRVDLAIAALQEARQIDPTNRDAALALDADQKQMDLDKAAKAPKPAVPAPAPAPSPTPSPTPAAPVPAPTAIATARPPAAGIKPPPEHRLLTAEEVNIIKQKEMSADDPALRVKFEDGVVKRYMDSGDHDPKAFAAEPQSAQAMEILATGDPKMMQDVHILNDPAPLLEFKKQIQPLVAMGCASTSCHGGTHAGDFSLYSGQNPAVLYTNFFILQTYSTTIDKVKYLAMDREVPDNSLVLNFGLPTKLGKPPHPVVPGFHPRFQSAEDPAYQLIYGWLNKSLKIPQPDYGLNVSPKIPVTTPPPSDK